MPRSQESNDDAKITLSATNGVPVASRDCSLLLFAMISLYLFRFPSPVVCSGATAFPSYPSSPLLLRRFRRTLSIKSVMTVFPPRVCRNGGIRFYRANYLVARGTALVCSSLHFVLYTMPFFFFYILFFFSFFFFFFFVLLASFLTLMYRIHLLRFPMETRFEAKFLRAIGGIAAAERYVLGRIPPRSFRIRCVLFLSKPCIHTLPSVVEKINRL